MITNGQPLTNCPIAAGKALQPALEIEPKTGVIVRKLRTRSSNERGEFHLLVFDEQSTYPEFKGNVAAVYSKLFCHGGASNSHYGGNAQTYMDVGLAMGEAMVNFLEGK